MDNVNLAVLDLNTAARERMAQGIPDDGAGDFVQQQPERQDGYANSKKDKIDGIHRRLLALLRDRLYSTTPAVLAVVVKRPHSSSLVLSKATPPTALGFFVCSA